MGVGWKVECLEEGKSSVALSLLRLHVDAHWCQLHVWLTSLVDLSHAYGLFGGRVSAMQLEGWWTYEFCYTMAVSQYHQEGDQRVASFILGRSSVNGYDVRFSLQDTP